MWPLAPAWSNPEYRGFGRPRKPKLVDGQSRTLSGRSDELPEEAWREITVAEGSQGHRTYRFSAQRVRVTRRRKPGEELWAIFRYLSNGIWTAANPATTCPTPRRTLPWRRSLGDAGPRGRFSLAYRNRIRDGAERRWTGRVRDPDLGRLASPHGAVPLGGAFLLSLQQDWGKKMPLLTRSQVYRVVREMLPRENFGPQELLRWMEWTQQRGERSRLSHQRRRYRLHRQTSGIPP